jgi:hypothetical protein
MGCLCSLSGIKIHFREFLYNIMREAQQTASASLLTQLGSMGGSAGPFGFGILNSELPNCQHVVFIDIF